MYASFGRVGDARRMLDQSRESYDVVCWNAMIDGYLRCGHVEAARELFETMPDKNVGSWNTMVSGLSRLGMIEEARRTFDLMQERDEISWSGMIDGYIRGGCYREALEVFNEMQRENFRPRKFVLSSVLAACANLGALDQGRWVHDYVKRNLIRLDAVLGTALVDMYAKCGRIDMAWKVFEETRDKEVSTWNAMIGGVAIHGRAEDAIELLVEMQREKLEPNGITFVGVLTACAHSGLVDEGLKILSSMERVYGVKPGVEHYGCIVDLLGRSGRLEEAEEVIRSMPMEPNKAVLGALLAACRIHGNVEFGERLGKVLLELDQGNGGRYALLSNIYAKAGKRDQVMEVRKLMKERGVKTDTGCSVLELGGEVHEFKMGDCSHPQSKEIYLFLETMIERLKTEGYVPDTSQVLFDIAEEQKEREIRYHSEKLAIAFGLINTEAKSTIRVVKNLRVCEDCHTAAKLISRVYDREIIVRDRVRYHHLKDGNCSCKDFW
ncbi:hypothetical protein CRG98_003484 [Punica granatum]|nr:hypothetical protein CRG98_003484 [Punica granatum]